MSIAPPVEQKTLPQVEVSDYVMVSKDTQFTRPFLAVVMEVDRTENQIRVQCFQTGRRWDTVWHKGDPRIEARAQLFGEGEDHAVFELTPKGKMFEKFVERLSAMERALQVLSGKLTKMEMEVTHLAKFGSRQQKK